MCFTWFHDNFLHNGPRFFSHLASAHAAAVGDAACLQPLQGHLHNPVRHDGFFCLKMGD